MPKTVDQIRQQIAKLREQEQALLQREVAGVVARIREAVEHYGLTAEQIFGSAAATTPSGNPRRSKLSASAPLQANKLSGRGKRKSKEASAVSAAGASPARAPSPVKGTKIAAKYKDEAGNTWSGRGSQPRWLRAALESGKKLEDFAIA